MNKFTSFILAFLLIVFMGCSKEKTKKDPIKPFSIATALPSAPNFISGVTLLRNNSFVVFTDDRNLRSSVFYLFDKNLSLVDTLILPLNDVSNMIVFDNSFIFMANLPNGEWHVFEMNYQLKTLQHRRINNLLFNRGGYQNTSPVKLAQLSDGSFIVACNQTSNIDNYVIVNGFNNLFTDTKRKWHWSAAQPSNDWLGECAVDPDGDFYVVGFVNDGTGSDNFFLKFGNDGSYVYRKDFPQKITNNNLFIEKNRLIYQDFTRIYISDKQGNYLADYPIDGLENMPVSNMVLLNGNYLYTKEFTNIDGKFSAIRKLNANFDTQKEMPFGNQGTNLINNGYFLKRYLMAFSTGELVTINIIEDPMLSGNQWLINKFRPDF